MALEIERKFLVSGDFKKDAYAHQEIVQGYLSSVAERTVRVRIKGEKAYLTVKGESSSSGVSRFEWEKEISTSDARELLTLCEPGIIDKIRYLVKMGSHVFEVDEFHGENEGLIVAEIELQNESEPFEKPEWLSIEVTGDIRYYNSSLIKNPYKNWKGQ
ncbi:CYTH domain-containing protein [Dysgonomonas sp. BGC7]|uniref:CYTH domain-containing protein n=1 Tax=Dysgonomonas sp. BGC7 TaxID=1658008 RepID=UPI000681D3C2|nr:CYTH domain-containing protein [Dysgonomonas sp. BGC7]MBD8387487.1 CYTH domain-containing protein [Dysgonomonas sp. BGC7]